MVGRFPETRRPSQSRVDRPESVGEIIGRLALEVQRREQTAAPVKERRSVGDLLYLTIVAGGAGLVAGNYVAWGASLMGVGAFMAAGVIGAVLMAGFVMLVIARAPR